MARRPSEEPSRKRRGRRPGPKSAAARRKTSSSRGTSGRQPTAEQPTGGAPRQPTVEQPTGERRTDRPASPIFGDRVLRRSHDDRVIAGVAGGVARYLGIDSLVVRIAFVILAFPLPGILLYLLGWIFIPEEREGEPVGPRPQAERGVDIWVLVGVGLVSLGVILLIDRLIPWFDRVTGPLILIALGAAVLVQGMRR